MNVKTHICVYCGAATTTLEALEHIIPEALGGKETLYPGAVCTKCNHELGSSVDGKVFKELMMAMGQVASGAEGKTGPRKTIRSRKGVVSKTNDGILMSGGVLGKPNEFETARVLAKVAVNVLTKALGSAQVRISHPSLIKYVRMPKNRHDVWPFVATYTPLKPVAFYGVAQRKSHFVRMPIRCNLVWLVCASGFFAMPLERGSKTACEDARGWVKSLVQRQKQNGAEFGLMVDYTAKNNEGLKPGKRKTNP